jgi:uncharacterized phage protein gp47/JayE
MAILIKTQEQIQSSILDSLEAEGTITDQSPGKVGYVLSQTIARELADVYRSTDLNTRLAYLTNAQGPLLDLWGAVFGIVRISEQAATASAASRNVKFFVTSGTLSGSIPTKVIPAGTQLSTAVGTGSPTYVTVVDTPFNDVAQEVFVTVSSTGLGVSQRIGKNQLVTHNLGDIGVSVTNQAAIANADDFETDEQFRARIADALLTGVSANTASILEAVSVIAGVSETRIEPFANGPGTVRLTVIPVANAANEDLLTQARGNVEITRGAGTRIDVRGPRFIPLEIVVILTFTPSVAEGEKDGIRSQAVDAILGYLNVLRIGQTFVINEMIQRVMDVNTGILDMEIRCFAFRKRPQVLRNFVPDPDEIIIPDPQLDQAIKVL